MVYLVSPNRKGTAAHVWWGTDTMCKMLSSGGMQERDRILTVDSMGRRLCHMCAQNAKKVWRFRA
jgi:hypothetical protein